MSIDQNKFFETFNMNKILFITTIVVAASGCQPKPPPQAMCQTIPVSTIPSGAMVYADGVESGISPTSVRLTKNAPHIVTIVKDGFATKMIPISVRVDQNRLLMKTLRSGLSSASSTNPVKGLNKAASAYELNDITGEANFLEPAIIAISLEPEASPTATTPASGQEK